MKFQTILVAGAAAAAAAFSLVAALPQSAPLLIPVDPVPLVPRPLNSTTASSSPANLSLSSTVFGQTQAAANFSTCSTTCLTVNLQQDTSLFATVLALLQNSTSAIANGTATAFNANSSSTNNVNSTLLNAIDLAVCSDLAFVSNFTSCLTDQNCSDSQTVASVFTLGCQALLNATNTTNNTTSNTTTINNTTNTGKSTSGAFKTTTSNLMVSAVVSFVGGCLLFIIA